MTERIIYCEGKTPLIKQQNCILYAQQCVDAIKYDSLNETEREGIRQTCVVCARTSVRGVHCRTIFTRPAPHDGGAE